MRQRRTYDGYVPMTRTGQPVRIHPGHPPFSARSGEAVVGHASLPLSRLVGACQRDRCPPTVPRSDAGAPRACGRRGP
jgi:hypothetical protein